LQFPANVIQYLTSPATFHITLRPKGRQVATTHIGYLSKITAANTLLVERGTTVDVEFTSIPRERRTGLLQVQFGQFDEEKSEWEMKDLVINKDFQLRPGRENRETGRFGTGVKPGLYQVAAWIGYDRTFISTPVFVQNIYVVDPTEANATLSDRALVYAIETDEWLVELEKVTGAIKGLTHKRYPDLNFAANEFNSTLAESKSCVLFGDFFVTSRKPRATWLEEASIHSTDVREVKIEADKLLTTFLVPSGKLGGFNNVQ